MPERRQANSTSSSSTVRPSGVRRNLFQHHLRPSRPASSSTSTSAETLRLDVDLESDSSDIVIRDHNGEFQIGDPPMQSFDDQDEAGHTDTVEDEKERQRLADAIKHYQRDRNRAPSEPAELLEAVKASLRAKVAALSEDNWLYEAEDDPITR